MAAAAVAANDYGCGRYWALAVTAGFFATGALVYGMLGLATAAGGAAGCLWKVLGFFVCNFSNSPSESLASYFFYLVGLGDWGVGAFVVTSRLVVEI